MPNGLPTLYPSIRTYDTMQQQPPQDHTAPLEMSLREHLLAAGAGQVTSPQPLAQHPHGGPPQAIDPAISGSPYAMSADTEGHTSEGRKGRRELSTSKRAAQNRAAQRAFRARKEEYIKQLKDQVKGYDELVEHYKNLQRENYQLRDYIISLQQRLLDTQGEVPPAPAGVNLSERQHPEHPDPMSHQAQQPQQQQSTEGAQASATANTNDGGLSDQQIDQLQIAAQAAAVAQHGPSASNGNHENAVGSYDAGDYANKHQHKPDDSTASGQPLSSYYPAFPTNEAAQVAHS
ncbi:uncharacterized protein EI97DRAFT_117919 [Westerdykella ornata]|uniref:Putative transcription factor kapC n=1 Tax=Westerdykella ornata TaxID=318751 RepID=A0A6A6JUN8_WESOR|nr:uncharacterized protein EI97DRAFT_117919 [Westerdykella ornata]KAF2280292.1 hypothetical protein EI97DRAFT_117919 [Westerdykella ornata]